MGSSDAVEMPVGGSVTTKLVDVVVEVVLVTVAVCLVLLKVGDNFFVSSSVTLSSQTMLRTIICYGSESISSIQIELYFSLDNFAKCSELVNLVNLT